MTDIRFYHLERSGLEQALPALLNKALSNGHRILVKTNQVEAMNGYLWTYDPNSFLPHGCAKDGVAEDQPVWITDQDENPNKADVLVLTEGLESENIADFKLCCEMLNGRNEDEVTAARSRWKTYKDKGFDVTYWQQGDKGWEKKAG